MSDWNYDMESCPLDTKVYLLSSDDCLLLPQREYVGTVTDNGRFKTRGECYSGDPDYFCRSAIVAWKPFELENKYMNNGHMKKSMTWYQLYKRIEKQTLHKTRNTKVQVLIDGELKECALVFTNNGSDFHLEPIRSVDKNE